MNSNCEDLCTIEGTHSHSSKQQLYRLVFLSGDNKGSTGQWTQFTPRKHRSFKYESNNDVCTHCSLSPRCSEVSAQTLVDCDQISTEVDNCGVSVG